MRQINEIEKMRNTCVAYGTFDGMHKGHLAVLRTLVAKSHAEGRMAVAVSLCPRGEEVLLTEEEKAHLMETTGVDVMISWKQWGRSLREDQIRQLLETLDAKVVVAGTECKDRVTLEGMGILLELVETVTYGEKSISREMLRECLEAGEMQTISELCGRPYRMSGVVVHGKALGRTVGMPTVNLETNQRKKKPMAGVYGSRTRIGNQIYLGVTNIGTRPTVDNLSDITIETMLLDFEQDVYGARIETELLCFLRGIHKFDSLVQVQEQVKKDAARVREEMTGDMN